MKILVTGASGMLGRDVCQAVQNAGHILAAFSRRDLDVTDFDPVTRTISRERPDAIIHCAAYTNVNGAETGATEAYRVNTTGTRYVAEACADNGTNMVYVSSDFVFDGAKNAPYVETDPTNPLGVYGDSKNRGENVIREILPRRHAIVRTAWLYGGPPETKNFVRTIQKLAKTLPEVPVVCDQIGCPTYTVPVAQTLVALAEGFAPGIYHAACEGQASWFEFAVEIVRLSGLQTPVIPITTADYAARFGPQAPRPAYSVLANTVLRGRGLVLPHWKNALADFVTVTVDGTE